MTRPWDAARIAEARALYTKFITVLRPPQHLAALWDLATDLRDAIEEIERQRAEIRRMVGCPTQEELDAEEERRTREHRLATARDAARADVERLHTRHGELRSAITTLLCQHCECRPVRLDRATYGHSHDCDDDLYEVYAKLLRDDGASVVDPEWEGES